MERRLLCPSDEAELIMGHFKHLISSDWKLTSARSLPLLREQLMANAISIQGGVAFMDGANRTWTSEDLYTWIEDSLVKPGWMRMPRTLREHGVGPVELDARTGAAGGFELLTLQTRTRVGAVLIKYLAPSPDERFLHAAIYGGRVRRGVIDGKTTWVPSPRETEFLSDIVLSLYAADLLQNPDRFRPFMCVCPCCSRVAFARGGQQFGRRCTRCSGEFRAIKVA